MTVDNDRILMLQDKLRQAVSHVTPEPGGSSSPRNASGAAGEAVRDPGSLVRAGDEALAVLIELAMARDLYVHHELMRLQRTLSRQSFRGAESARRLVRRLARKAEQNVHDLRLGTLTSPSPNRPPAESGCRDDVQRSDRNP